MIKGVVFYIGIIAIAFTLLKWLFRLFWFLKGLNVKVYKYKDTIKLNGFIKVSFKGGQLNARINRYRIYVTKCNEHVFPYMDSFECLVYSNDDTSIYDADAYPDDED